MTAVPHILIVEDQANTAEMLTSYFEAQGYEVTTVGWGSDALSFVEKQIPDLIMLDIRLPDIDGYEVCRRLRAHRRTEHIPIIFLTERRERGDKLAGLGLGAVDYITKPFDVQELRLRVRNVLRRSSMERLSHPITGLPTSSLVDERLHELMHTADWAILSVGLHGLKEFAETYGFVARDDVVRAVGLMLSHIASESGDPEAFVGHLDDANFFVILDPAKMAAVRKALMVRLDEAIAFFYPRADWEASRTNPEVHIPRMTVTIGVFNPPPQPLPTLESFKKAIVDAQEVTLGAR
ncbi:MAG: response regulator [Anaerolineae bacterium]|nr:response regulator [Anaerolineae bacterium]